MTPAPISVERLRELLAKATPGPWEADAGTVRPAPESPDRVTIAYCSGEGSPQGEADAELIAAAVNALPTLLHQLAERDAEVERLKAEVQRRHDERLQILQDSGSDQFDLIKRAEAAERAKEALGQSIRDAQAAVCTSMAAFNMTGAVFVADPKLAERMAADSLLWQARAARAHAIPSISNCLEYGRTFLQRSHLRSVRNLSLLIAAGQNTVIEDLLSKLSPNEKAPCYEIIKAWITEDSSALRIAGAEWEKYKEWINREEPDDFAGCYFFDGGISGKGLQLRLETRVCKNAK